MMAYRNSFKQAVRNSKRLIAAIRQRSRQASADLIHLCKESEALKVDVFLNLLEEEKEVLLRSRGLESVLKGENRQVTLSRVILGSILGAFETHHAAGH